ncbi:919dd2f2-2926-4510-8b4e-48488fa36736 [Sclerotinia trifoliorum]|uniref:919dd2f2-2926-4510-8b4e-48488fa36736 n=1 Tax=Sclerotinia trifoliorum TaxID=28548 RepID=A0A8H2ZTL4_9HELO|nr:919dd2f2-2926-4510-8b4e-48488fa36736 [Sclerotinia trifoliorum]
MATMKGPNVSHTQKPGAQPVAGFAAIGQSYTNASSRHNRSQPYAFGLSGDRVTVIQTISQPGESLVKALSLMAGIPSIGIELVV